MQMLAENPTGYPGIVRGLELLRLAEERRLIDHLVRLGSEPAHQRIASCFIELLERCRAIGFVTGGSFAMPLTHEKLSEYVGLSPVHVSRVLRQLRADGLIRLQPGVAEIVDLPGLARVAATADRLRPDAANEGRYLPVREMCAV